jgi:tRNA-2-methylthio-N6-dimethylallyladenosine synthase
MIAGFQQKRSKTIKMQSLMEYVKYNFGYMYSYSNVREHWQEEDDVTDETKARRLQEIENKTLGTIHWSNRRSFSRKV